MPQLPLSTPFTCAAVWLILRSEKETNMSAIALAENVFWVGAKDPELRMFDLIVKTNYGTTYNSYLLRGEKVALIDAVKDGFEDQLFAAIQEILPLSKLDYLIVNHNEPDHSGAIVKLLQANPGIKLVCAKPAVPFLRNVINDEARTIEGVKGGDKLDLGGLTLEFLATPFMHWPDTMMCYNPEHKILFSCDGFAAHFCPTESIFHKPGDQLLIHEAWYYYDCIMRPFAPFSRKAAQAIAAMDIATVAPSHGLVNRAEPKLFIEKYLEWTEPKHRSDRKLIAILYASAYGNTAIMARAVCDALDQAKCEPHLIDVTASNDAELRDWLESADGILFGTPTFAGDVVKPIWDAAHLLTSVAATGKKTAVFGSYAWGGQAIEILESYLEALKLKVMKPGTRARLVPGPGEIEDCRRFGSDFSKFVAE